MLLKEDAKDDDEVSKHCVKGDENLLNHAEASGWKILRLRDPAQDNLILFIKPVQDISEEIAATAIPVVGAGVTINVYQTADAGEQVGQEVEGIPDV